MIMLKEVKYKLYEGKYLPCLKKCCCEEAIFRELKEALNQGELKEAVMIKSTSHARKNISSMA